MCLHEENSQPTSWPEPKNAWRLIEAHDGAMTHLYNLDALLNGVRMSMEHLNEDSSDASLCHLVHLCVMADEQLEEACRKLEASLSEIKILKA